MEEVVKQYEDYYLIKCYSKKNYQSEFNKGNIYLKELSYFHNVENQFQQDKEGIIFQQEEKSVAVWHALDSVTSAVFSDLANKGEFDEANKILENESKQIGKTTDLKVYINGFLICFYLIPKAQLNISEDNIDISPLEEYNNFVYFLNSYAKEQGYTYFSVYNASQLIGKLCQAFNKQDYGFSFGCVNYQDVDEKTKNKWFSEKQMSKIIFTKPLIFKYQREFRFFISPKNRTIGDAITITSDNLESTVVSSLTYLTPEYCKRMKERCQSEIQL